MIDPITELLAYRQLGSTDEVSFSINFLESLISILEKEGLEDLIFQAAGMANDMEDEVETAIDNLDSDDEEEEGEFEILDMEEVLDIAKEVIIEQGAEFEIISLSDAEAKEAVQLFEFQLFEKVLRDGGIWDMFGE